VFRTGINDYLSTHRYGNTETSDLWDALERASGRAVRTIMDTWIDQGGYPLVRVAHNGLLSVEPFSYQGSPGGAIGSQWLVPVLTRSLEDPATEPTPVLLDQGPGTAPVVTAPATLVNAGGSGYFRVAYPTDVVVRLAAGLGDLEPLERYNLVSDAWAASLSGQAPLTDLLRVARALVESDEGDPSVWSVVLGALGLLDRVVPDGDRSVVQEAVRSLIGPLATALGWDPRSDDGERTPSLRASVLRTLGVLGEDRDIQEEAVLRFGRAQAHEVVLDPDTESAILDIVASHGGAGDYERILDRYRNPANPQEENRYLYALASFVEPELAERTFDLALSEVRTQNAPFVLQALLANRVVGPSTWRRITREWDALVERFPSNILPRMLDGVRGLCNPPTLAEEVSTFVAAHPLPSGGRTVEQILERLGVNVVFGEREGPSLAATLRNTLDLA
jgi:puromycin-sensitive aminopeptidase